MTDTNGGRSLEVAEKTLEIYEFIVAEGSIGVTALAEELQLPKGTVHAYLTALVRTGYLRNDDGQYSPSLRILKQGGFVRNRIKLFQVARHYIDELADVTGEVANLGIKEDFHRVIVYESEGENALWDDTPVGDHAPLNQTAMGKAILAALPQESVEAAVKSIDLPAATPKTIKDQDELFEELERITERGYSLEDEEHREGIRSLGRAIVVEDTVLGALAVCGPKSRFDDEGIEKFASATRDATNQIELTYKHY